MTPNPVSQSEGAVGTGPDLSVPPSVPLVSQDVPARLEDPALLLRRPKPEWRRLFFHVGACTLAGILCRFIDDPYWRGGLVITALVGTLLHEYLIKGGQGWLARKMKLIERRREHRTRTAGTDFIVAMSVSAFVFRPDVACAGFLVTALADPAARLFGTQLTATPRVDRRKTIEGSAGFLLVAMIAVTLSFVTENLAIIFAASFAGMLAERPRQRVIKTWFGPVMTPADNFWIPIVVSTVLTVMIILK